MKLNKEELEALAHALGNTLCHANHPDFEVLSNVREKIRKELGVIRKVRSIKLKVRSIKLKNGRLIVLTEVRQPFSRHYVLQIGNLNFTYGIDDSECQRAIDSDAQLEQMAKSFDHYFLGAK